MVKSFHSFPFFLFFCRSHLSFTLILQILKLPDFAPVFLVRSFSMAHRLLVDSVVITTSRWISINSPAPPSETQIEPYNKNNKLEMFCFYWPTNFISSSTFNVGKKNYFRPISKSLAKHCWTFQYSFPLQCSYESDFEFLLENWFTQRLSNYCWQIINKRKILFNSLSILISHGLILFVEIHS